MNGNISKVEMRLQWWILTIAILVLFLSELVEQSMYIDGVWYAVIAQNLSNGEGSFWFPQFSETLFSAFHEHPPFMFWIQSLFFDLIGNHWLTERIYCLVQYIITSFLIVSIWQKCFVKHTEIKSLWVIPLLLWQVNLASYYFLPANLLENTQVVFDLLAVYFLMSFARRPEDYFKILLAAFFLFLAFLTKGLTGLFPLVFLGIYWIVFRSTTLPKAILQTAILGASFLGLLGLLFWINPEALQSLSKYWDVQVLASLSGERRLYFFRETRFYILGQLLITLAPMIFTLLVSIGLTHLFNISPRLFFKTRQGKYGLVFFLVGLSASLPIMISPRQALPYLLPSLPFFSLAFGSAIAFYFTHWRTLIVEQINGYFPKLEKVLIILTIGSAILCFQKFETTNKRDAIVINDSEKIGSVVGPRQIISSTHYDMYIAGYLMRFDQVSLDTIDLNREFLIAPKAENLTLKNFDLVPLATLKYNLYKRKSSNSAPISDVGETINY
jgi:hypothetical protein